MIDFGPRRVRLESGEFVDEWPTSNLEVGTLELCLPFDTPHEINGRDLQLTEWPPAIILEFELSRYILIPTAIGVSLENEEILYVKYSHPVKAVKLFNS